VLGAGHPELPAVGGFAPVKPRQTQRSGDYAAQHPPPRAGDRQRPREAVEPRLIHRTYPLRPSNSAVCGTDGFGFGRTII
jgi:hypothetical protein